MTCPKWALFRAGDGPKVPDAPYPAHYRRTLAFSDILSPLEHRHPLRGSYRRRCVPDPMGVTAFRRDDTRREGASFRPPILLSLCSQSVRRAADRFPFGSGLSASFDLLTIHGPSVGGSRAFTLRLSLAPGPPRCWQVRISPHGSIRPRRGGYVVPAASDPTVTSHAWAGRLPVREDGVQLINVTPCLC